MVARLSTALRLLTLHNRERPPTRYLYLYPSYYLPVLEVGHIS